MIGTAIPVGAIRYPAAARVLPPSFVPTVYRRNGNFGTPAVAAPIVAILGFIGTLVGAAVGVGTTAAVLIAAKKKTLEGLRKTLNNKQELLDKTKNANKADKLRDQIKDLKLSIATVEAQMQQVIESGQPQESGTPAWMYGAGAIVTVVVLGGTGYLLFGGRGRAPRRNPRRRRSR